MKLPEWMIYGANGYTGQLIAERAVQKGLQPILAGRSPEVAMLGQRLGLKSRIFSLDEAREPGMLDDIRLVLHCAGPFSATSKPMLDACLRVHAHYLDITGEIPVFESIFARTREIRAAGIAAIPGVGFDVVPSDCLAALLKKRVPDATHLILAFLNSGGPSPGTAKTMIEGFAQGGRIRRAGRIVEVPPMHSGRMIDFGRGETWCVTIPWGDVSTAFHSTGIPNIEVLVPQSRTSQRIIRFLSPGLSAIASHEKLQVGLQKLAGRFVTGSNQEERSRGFAVFWGQVASFSPPTQSARLRLKTPDGYELTAEAALAAVQRTLVTPCVGANTPSTAFGADFVLSLAGVTLEEVDSVKQGN
jgi:short subunit dehydrogenase-like uncharacterized protein